MNEMNVVISCLLCFYIIYYVNLQGGEAASYTNGFPSRLVYNVSFRCGYSTRLIPEMNFVCNGNITGYTAALRRDRSDGDLDPIIQVWRINMSRPGSYYSISAGIAINETLCVGGLRNISSGVFHCNLSQNIYRVAVQPGDILGLELPKWDSNDIRLAFARVNSGPTNYIFYTRETLSAVYTYSGLFFWPWMYVNRELPQITLEVESDNSKCIRGFPDIPVSQVDGHTSIANITTLLIPEMNFTCSASIVGFTVAGRNLSDEPHSQVQIWHKNSSPSSSIYYQVGKFNISLRDGVCVATGAIVGDTFWCILHDNFSVPVQQGDIFGLELPATDSDEILFTSGGPMNYIFKHPNQLDSYIYINLSHNRSSTAQQLPQIMFNLTSAHCLSGFPGKVIFEENKLWIPNRTQRITRLFPSLKFGCFGTIVRVTAAVWDTVHGEQAPKIQIWREDKNQPGLYYKTSSDVQIKVFDPICYQNNISNRIFECTLREGYRISVQPGDFLGLEIPHYFDDDLVVYFKAGGPTNLVFHSQLGSTVDLFTEPYTITNTEPQINFLVVLDETRDSCPSKVTTTTTLTTADYTTESESVGSSPAASSNTIAGGAIGGIIAILLLVAIILLVAVLIQRTHRKQYTLASNGHTNPIANPVYDGASYNTVLPTKKCEASYKDDTPTSYDHIKFNVKKEAVSLHTNDQNINVTYETLGMQHYEMAGPTLATHEEPYIYWEPANSVNDLHKQLSSNKYRELLRQQVKITKALGSGQFGVVSMGVWQSPTGAMEVAVKQLQPGVTETEKIRFLQEAAINGQFRHPNVVQLMGVVTTGEPAMIVLELLSNGDLRNFLVKHQTHQKLESGGVDKHLLLQFCQHIASGMSYLASKAFVHRDLAARNILVSKDRTCKISDFGMSRDLLDEDYYVSHGGMIPVKWTAPEAIHYKKYSTAGDVWSFGCVMYEIWSLGHKPFESYNNPEVIKMIDNGYRLPPPPGLSKELYKIMIQCWQPERSHRPTFPQLVELLSRADFELFLWEEKDLRNSDPRVKEIGAPLEIASGLYPELQRTYQNNKAFS